MNGREKKLEFHFGIVWIRICYVLAQIGEVRGMERKFVQFLFIRFQLLFSNKIRKIPAKLSTTLFIHNEMKMRENTPTSNCRTEKWSAFLFRIWANDAVAGILSAFVLLEQNSIFQFPIQHTRRQVRDFLVAGEQIVAAFVHYCLKAISNQFLS